MHIPDKGGGGLKKDLYYTKWWGVSAIRKREAAA